MTSPTCHILDYGAGNVRSLHNAVRKVGFEPVTVTSPSQLTSGEVTTLVFPGVGAFGGAMEFLHREGYTPALRQYLATPGRAYLGICIGLQTLFEGSEESPGVEGLGVIKGTIQKFPASGPAVPQIGWNGVKPRKPSRLFSPEGWNPESRVYFVHSYRAKECPENSEWVAATTTYGEDDYVSVVQRGNVMAVQFHPEKSGDVGLNLIKCFLQHNKDVAGLRAGAAPGAVSGISRRVVACLDVRTNDDGDLVVTKGDSYDVREPGSKDEPGSKKQKGAVRNLGKPVDLASRYYEEGADEITFLNITSFRSEPLEDAPLLGVLEATSKCVFVPLTIGGGIRDYTDVHGKTYSAREVADRYFRAGADKISIGTDAVYASEKLMSLGGERGDGTSCIEQISRGYGAQAVVISIDPRRVYLDSAEAVAQAKAKGHTVLEVDDPRPGKAPGTKALVWYQCTVKGGREGRDMDAVRLAQCCEKLGAGEILVNSIDADGQKSGFDAVLIGAVTQAVSLPVIASSGAGTAQHFVDIFQRTRCEAALAAGIFHRKEVPIALVKGAMKDAGLPVR